MLEWGKVKNIREDLERHEIRGGNKKSARKVKESTSGKRKRKLDEREESVDDIRKYFERKEQPAEKVAKKENRITEIRKKFEPTDSRKEMRKEGHGKIIERRREE